MVTLDDGLGRHLRKWLLVLHLLGNFVRVQNSRHAQVIREFVQLGLLQRCVSLFHEQIAIVLTGQLLQVIKY